ncbi:MULTISPECIES: TnsA endonuclease N-terminal domain-containing protein [unclassified Pseudomonas]|uniref:TnsA endonuclease N-terminal domain-containing protein n=1 Tax=unclassified Pseudomonas TaxID=196821 RepID=UPI0005CFA818|nr:MULTISPECIES: TnsA endonuclease N-terminal domain-containing protein [unclassified Pseudomonas]MDH4874395.1 hypothetical protein [Pseudomonas sp. BN515]
MGLKNNSPKLNPPSRNIESGHFGKHLVYFPSLKNCRQIVCESKLEADFCLLLEFDQNIISYHPQPITISTVVGDKKRRYTPDFLVKRRYQHDLYVEIKPDAQLLSNNYLEYILQAKAKFQKRGADLLLIDAKKIRTHHKLNNLRTIYSRIHNTTKLEDDYLQDFIKENVFPCSIERLISTPNAPTLNAILKAIFTHKLYVNLNEPISLSSTVDSNHEQ